MQLYLGIENSFLIDYFLRSMFSQYYCLSLFMEQPHKGLAGFKQQEYEPSIAESNVRSVISHTSHQTLIQQFKLYEARSAILDLVKLKASTHLKLKKFKESAYFGQIVNGKRHGQGVMIYNNERVYEGNWQNDYKQGPGYELFPNASVYQGMYVNGKPQGVGKYSWPNGQFFQGQWLNGVKHGSGMWQGAKGDSYIGEWKMGKADGYGVHVWVNGDRYEGQFKQCLKHGQGTQKFANGDLYKGQYSKGKPNGYGEYYWSNGSYFKGNFKQGLRQGHGMWKKGPGLSDKYEGEYIADKKHGYGIFTWTSGNVYKGHYIQDLRNDFGQMYWADGSSYKGQWMKGIQNGQGVLYAPNEGTKRGKFKDNALVELLEQEPYSPPQQQIIHNIPRPGSIQKNSQQVPPLEPHRPNYRSIQNRKKLYSLHNHPQKHACSRLSKDLNPIAYRGENKVNKTTTHTVDLDRVVSNKGTYKTKEKIPHSAYYMHKLHKRVSTANNEVYSQSSKKSKGQIVQELRSFTKKMVGRRGY